MLITTGWLKFLQTKRAERIPHRNNFSCTFSLKRTLGSGKNFYLLSDWRSPGKKWSEPHQCFPSCRRTAESACKKEERLGSMIKSQGLPGVERLNKFPPTLNWLTKGLYPQGTVKREVKQTTDDLGFCRERERFKGTPFVGICYATIEKWQTPEKLERSVIDHKTDMFTVLREIKEKL